MLGPFVSRHKVVVTPVVVLVDEVPILDNLHATPGEVSHIFDHPLEALLDPELARSENLVPIGSKDEAEFYNYTDNAWMGTTCRHAPFLEHRLAYHRTLGRHSSMTPFFLTLRTVY
jgi:hypothetical protein